MSLRRISISGDGIIEDPGQGEKGSLGTHITEFSIYCLIGARKGCLGPPSLVVPVLIES